MQIIGNAHVTHSNDVVFVLDHISLYLHRLIDIISSVTKLNRLGADTRESYPLIAVDGGSYALVLQGIES